MSNTDLLDLTLSLERERLLLTRRRPTSGDCARRLTCDREDKEGFTRMRSRVLSLRRGLGLRERDDDR